MLPPHRGRGGAAAAADPDFFCFNGFNRGDDAWMDRDVRYFDGEKDCDGDTKPNRKK